jgi:hypothetical protein
VTNIGLPKQLGQFFNVDVCMTLYIAHMVTGVSVVMRVMPFPAFLVLLAFERMMMLHPHSLSGPTEKLSCHNLKN